MPIHPSTQLDSIKNEFYSLLEREQKNLLLNNRKTIKIDLHCHDRNSDKPDELWGRILGLRETWITSEALTKTLFSNGVHAITITNHNNALSCWQMMEKGHDILAAAEFTCFFKEYDLYLHVLTYGLTPQHEDKLNSIRHNIFKFLEYTNIHNLPTILPHPLYFYTRSKLPSFEAFEKLSLMFERFECLNGQRDIWQNALTAKWIRGLTPEKLELLSKKHGIKTNEFCRNPYKKSLSGGSDDHMAIYAGSCGTLLEVNEDKHVPLSMLALDAIRQGNMAPYGKVASGDRLALTFLDYFCQVVTNMEDPGLMRVMLHQGKWHDKLACAALGNLFLELKQNGKTHKLFDTIHKALHGKKPNKLIELFSPKPIKKTIKKLTQVAESRKNEDNTYEEKANDLMLSTFKNFSWTFADFLEKKLVALFKNDFSVDNLDFPLQFRELTKAKNDIEDVGVSTLLTLILSSAKIAGSRAINNGRDFLNSFAKNINQENIDNRLLFFVEDFFEQTPRGRLFREMHFLCVQEKLPIDFITCTNSKEEVPNLIKIKPLKVITLGKGLPQLYIPDYFELHEFFRKANYDQVLSCGSILSSLSCLLLKECFVVNAHIFACRDWHKILERKYSLDSKKSSQLKRIIRFYYKQFSTVFAPSMSMVRNLSKKKMNLDKNNIIWLDLHSQTDSLASLYLITHKLGLSSGEKKKFESSLFQDIYQFAFEEDKST